MEEKFLPVWAIFGSDFCPVIRRSPLLSVYSFFELTQVKEGLVVLKQRVRSVLDQIAQETRKRAARHKLAVQKREWNLRIGKYLLRMESEHHNAECH